MDASSQAAAAQPKIIPDGWVPIGPSLAWVAFGTALNEQEWNERLYFGASRWFDIPPAQVADELRDFIENDEKPFTGTYDAPDLVAALHCKTLTTDRARATIFSNSQALAQAASVNPYEESESLIRQSDQLVRASASPGLSREEAWQMVREARGLLATAGRINEAILSPQKGDLKAAASEVLASLDAKVAAAQSSRDALWKASDALRRAIGGGDLPVYGWPGALPKDKARKVAPVRQRVPPEVCQAPVTVTHDGILAFVKGYDFPEEYGVLWHGILLDAQDLLRLWPVTDIGAPTVPYRHPEPEAGQRRGGRPPKHDWKPFRLEVSRRLALDGGHMSLTAFRKSMKEWVAQNMPEPGPDERTIERQLDEQVPPDVLAPD